MLWSVTYFASKSKGVSLCVVRVHYHVTEGESKTIQYSTIT